MERNRIKTFAVFVIVGGCAAVFYPKILHPILVYMLGMNVDAPDVDAVLKKQQTRMMPPHHYRTGVSGKNIQQPRDSYPLKGVPLPDLRASVDAKKGQSTTSTEGNNKGMMGVVLPMYAVGIVLYLLYPLVKVITRRDKNERRPHGADYLNDQYLDGCRTRGESEQSMSMKERMFRQQEDLEKLLLRADKDDISDGEMTELRRKLLETEAQMSRILRAMESVQESVSTFACETISDGYSEVGPINSNLRQYDDDDEYDASDDEQDHDDSDLDENDTYIENIDTMASKTLTQRNRCDVDSEPINRSKLRNVKNFSDECGELTESFTFKRDVNEEKEKQRGMACEKIESQCENRYTDNDDSFLDEDELQMSRTEQVVSEGAKCRQRANESFTRNEVHRRILSGKEL